MSDNQEQAQQAIQALVDAVYGANSGITVRLQPKETTGTSDYAYHIYLDGLPKYETRKLEEGNETALMRIQKTLNEQRQVLNEQIANTGLMTKGNHIGKIYDIGLFHRDSQLGSDGILEKLARVELPPAKGL